MNNDFNWLLDYIKETTTGLNDTGLLDKFVQAKSMILSCRDRDGSIYLFGNGGSNAIGTHISVDFANMVGMKCFNFNDPSVITAHANDYGYENSMERFVKLFCRDGDVLMFISSSGESPNIINAAKQARKQQCEIITFSAFNKDNTLSKTGDINFWTPSKIYNISESIHFVWLAWLCDFIIKDEKETMGPHGKIL